MKTVSMKSQKSRSGGGTGSQAGRRVTGAGSVPTGGSKSVVRTSERARIPVLSESVSEEDGEGGAVRKDGAVRNLGSAMDDAADKDGAQALLQLADQGAHHAAAPATTSKRGRKTIREAFEAAKLGKLAISPPHKESNASHHRCACSSR